MGSTLLDRVDRKEYACRRSRVARLEERRSARRLAVLQARVDIKQKLERGTHIQGGKLMDHRQLCYSQ